MACSVVVTVGEVANPFIEKLQQKADAITIGNGLNNDVFLGPVIRKEHKERKANYIEVGQQEGAVLVRDGRKDGSYHKDGYFIGPTIFDHVKTDMKIWKEEIFAPVLSIVRVNSLEEAIQSEFGNGSCLFTNDARNIRYFREKIQSGMLGINTEVPAPMAFFPFSGWKNSFYGDLHANGPDGVEFYTRRKMVTSRLSFNE